MVSPRSACPCSFRHGASVRPNRKRTQISRNKMSKQFRTENPRMPQQKLPSSTSLLLPTTMRMLLPIIDLCQINYPAASSGVLQTQKVHSCRSKLRGIEPQGIKLNNSSACPDYGASMAPLMMTNDRTARINLACCACGRRDSLDPCHSLTPARICMAYNTNNRISSTTWNHTR